MFAVSQVPLHTDPMCAKHCYQKMHNESLASFRNLFTVAKGPLDGKLQPVLSFLKASIVSAFAALEGESRCTCWEGGSDGSMSFASSDFDYYGSDSSDEENHRDP